MLKWLNEQLDENEICKSDEEKRENPNHQWSNRMHEEEEEMKRVHTSFVWSNVRSIVIAQAEKKKQQQQRRRSIWNENTQK